MLEEIESGYEGDISERYDPQVPMWLILLHHPIPEHYQRQDYRNKSLIEEMEHDDHYAAHESPMGYDEVQCHQQESTFLLLAMTTINTLQLHLKNSRHSLLIIILLLLVNVENQFLNDLR